MLLNVLALMVAVAGAEESSVLRGRVLDPTRAPIAGARVSARSSTSRLATSTETDGSGSFALTLTAGAWTIRVAAPGFLAASQTVDTMKADRPGVELFGTPCGRCLECSSNPCTVAPGSPELFGTPCGRCLEFVLSVARLRESVTVRARGGYEVDSVGSATKTFTALRDVPQSVTVTTKELIRDQLMLSIGDVMRYTPGIQVHQGENNRDQVVIRGNSSSADFFLNGVRDDVQYYRDLYNLERIEALKGPNAMMFGRGGGGGVVNRVTKEAVFQPVRELSVQAGAYGHKRLAGDFDQPVSDKIALRLNGMYEDSDSFRNFVNLERYAINPTLTLAPSPATRITLAYEHLHDTRVADRGLTSYQGRPADVDVSTYYGNPADSHVRARVDLVTTTLERRAGRSTIRNRTLFGAYDRFYQNYVPGAVAADKSRVALTAYNNQTKRDNLFSQTDLILPVSTGRITHTLLGGIELGRQDSDNFRNTGYFNGTATSLSLPYSEPTIGTAATFRQSPTDADNHLKARVLAVYLQDQAKLSAKVQLVAGLRFDRFDLRYHNNRSGQSLARADNLVSPRMGMIYQPIAPVSVYGSYTVSYLPSSGDQFSSLTTITEQAKPERFASYEGGVKWEPHPGLALTAAAYRLDRRNTRAPDPNDPTRIVQTGSQRTKGVEVGIAGQITSAWRIAGGYARQDAIVTSATTAAQAGARVAQVPRHTLSLWNHYQVLPRLGAALGLLYRTDIFATIDNSVLLPGYTRLDFAAFYSLTKELRMQANLENALNRKYWANADSNTNLSPGSPRTLRFALAAGF
jgi:catecholate siderophore receptor